MKLFDAIKRFFNMDDYEEDDALNWYSDDDAREELVKPTLFGKKRVNLNDEEQMEKYIVGCCEQIRTANDEIETASGEYRLVTEYLMDMENLSSIDEDIWRDIEDAASAITTSGKDIQRAKQRTQTMDEEKYRLCERYEDDIPKTIENMKKNEEYKVLVRDDLKNLEGEKISYRFRDRELKANMKGAREITVVILMAIFFMVAILAVMQYMLGYDVMIGYFLVIGIGAIAMTLCFLAFSKASTEDKRVVKLLNEAITTQNTVKIRYVNVTNLIDYQYAKYKVNSSNELQYFWSQYIKEKKTRETIRRANAELEGARADLMFALQKAELKYPEMWLSQAEALLDDGDLREIRHDLITRRQGLRKRVDYNEKVREAASEEIKEVMADYPKHSGLILEVVGRYE